MVFKFFGCQIQVLDLSASKDVSFCFSAAFMVFSAMYVVINFGLVIFSFTFFVNLRSTIKV